MTIMKMIKHRTHLGRKALARVGFLAALISLLSGPRTLAFSMSSAETTGPLEEKSDRLNRWFNRWDENKLGWHREEVNHGLLTYGEKHIVNKDSCPAEGLRWFVPLCGKTVDMAYLAGHENTAHVVGVDGIRKALDEFGNEHPDLQIAADKKRKIDEEESAFDRLSGKKITLLKGDYFMLDEKATGGRFDAILDRASMVAIDPSLREKYVEVISKLAKPGAKILLVTIERRTGEKEALAKGPPFSISEAEVRRLYEGQDWVESVTLLEEIDEFEKTPEDKARYEGVTSMYELHFLIVAKPAEVEGKEVEDESDKEQEDEEEALELAAEDGVEEAAEEETEE